MQDGQTIGGKIAIVAQVAGHKIAKAVFKLDGPKSVTYTEKATPYTFMGDVNGVPNGWDSTQYPNGSYMLSATVTNTSGQHSVAMIHFQIVNGGQTPNPTAVPTVPPTSVPAATSTPAAGGSGHVFLEPFDGSPAGPQPWRPANWDVAIHSRSATTWGALEPMHAMHGNDCGAPPAMHDVSAYEDAVFQCRDQMIQSGKPRRSRTSSPRMLRMETGGPAGGHA